MIGAAETQEMNLAKRWIISLGIFFIVQIIFLAVDGTYLEPNINDSDILVARIGRWILDSKLFTEWITPYSFPFFNMFITIHVITLLIQLLKDLFLRYKKNE